MGFGWNLSETNFEHQQLETWFLEKPHILFAEMG
jgi:hypothetical protein